MTTNRCLINGLAGLTFVFFSIVTSGCYTVLKQSGEYYSEFGQSRSDRSESNQEKLIPEDSLSVAEDSVFVSEDQAETVVINRYYYNYSPWWGGYGYGYPGRYWNVTLGYTWYPGYGLYPYDYYYWGGCYYPAYPGDYYSYYPYPWYAPDPHYPSNSLRRNYGLRHDVMNSSASGFNRIHSASIPTVFTQRQYNTVNSGSTTTVSQSKKEIKDTKKNRRRYTTKSSHTASRTVEKTGTVKNKNSGERQYKEVDIPKNNSRSEQRGFENAKTHTSRNDNSGSRSYNDNSSRGGSSSRSSGSRSSSPNSGGRTYNSRK